MIFECTDPRGRDQGPRAAGCSRNLRRAMTKFQPTEAEFQAIFRAWRAHDENLAVRYAAGEPDPGNAHVFEAIAQALTPDRYPLYRET